MALSTGLNLRLRSRLALSPVMRQSLSILRMPAAELMELALREAEENPLLRLSAPMRNGGAYEIALETVSARPGLVASLIHQLRQRALPADVLIVAEWMAGALREDGYLDCGLEEIAAEIGATIGLVERGLAALQSCEPCGIGARDLAECIAIQLADRGVAPDLARRVPSVVEELMSGRLGQAARRLGITEEEARRIAGLLRSVDPRPVKEEADPGLGVLQPDLTVRERADGTLFVEPARDLPLLRLDTRLVASGVSPEGRARAEALIAALRQRSETLVAIGNAILQRQEAFFREGPDALRPLSRVELASELGLHPSTLGRAVADKALEAWGRVHPLSLFFSAPVTVSGQEAPLSAFVLGRRIARIVAAEAPEAPLSDQEIAARLSADGVDIARRTVAKYREGMRIPSSWRRRRAGARRGSEG